MIPFHSIVITFRSFEEESYPFSKTFNTLCLNAFDYGAGKLVSLLVLDLMYRAISPILSSPSILQIVPPLPLILCSIFKSVHSISVGLSIPPFSFKSISICLPDLSFPVRLILPPLALVPRSIRLNFNPIPFSHVAHPIA